MDARRHREGKHGSGITTRLEREALRYFNPDHLGHVIIPPPVSLVGTCLLVRLQQQDAMVVSDLGPTVRGLITKGFLVAEESKARTSLLAQDSLVLYLTPKGAEQLRAYRDGSGT